MESTLEVWGYTETTIEVCGCIGICYTILLVYWNLLQKFVGVLESSIGVGGIFESALEI